MTTQPDERIRSPIPEWSQGDRMRKSLEHANIAVQQMADYLGVTRTTVSNWLHDRVPPSRQTRILWAHKTGVPLEWIETGKTTAAKDGDTLFEQLSARSSMDRASDYGSIFRRFPLQRFSSATQMPDVA